MHRREGPEKELHKGIFISLKTGQSFTCDMNKVKMG